MVKNTDKLPEVVWMRVGDEDSYHPFDAIEDAAQHLGEFYSIRQIVFRNRFGVTTPGFEGNNYISLYWGTDPKDGSAEMTRALTDDEIDEFNLSLEAIVDCEKANAHEASNSDEGVPDRNDADTFLCIASTTPSNAFQYIVEITQPSHGTTFYRSGHGIYERDQSKATRFDGYLPTLHHITAILTYIVLNEPVEIRLLPAPNNRTWTVQEILAREG